MKLYQSATKTLIIFTLFISYSTAMSIPIEILRYFNEQKELIAQEIEEQKEQNNFHNNKLFTKKMDILNTQELKIRIKGYPSRNHEKKALKIENTCFGSIAYASNQLTVADCKELGQFYQAIANDIKAIEEKIFNNSSTE